MKNIEGVKIYYLTIFITEVFNITLEDGLVTVAGRIQSYRKKNDKTKMLTQINFPLFIPIHHNSTILILLHYPLERLDNLYS